MSILLSAAEKIISRTLDAGEWACDRLHRRGIYSAALNTDGIQTCDEPTELHDSRTTSRRYKYARRGVPVGWHHRVSIVGQIFTIRSARRVVETDESFVRN